MSDIVESVRMRLFDLQDLDYKAFHCKLMPTVPPEAVIGVRTPEIRQLARELSKTPETAAEYLGSLPHRYYEENNLHGALLSLLRDYGQTVEALEEFLPYVDNWATCDLLSPKAFRKHPEQLPEQARRWMDSQHVYTARFGIGVLLSFYLDEAFQPEYLAWVSQVRGGEYYVDMMAAWYFATALAKQYEAALPYLEQGRLGLWVHNKTIQKAIESRRITAARKAYLRTLRRKEGA
ncbi:MAG: DNA alkylation repair protein [Oscillospiraceae bacterium]|nr:DNA alkylation repair protein [Oscillospiraceae bacterium]